MNVKLNLNRTIILLLISGFLFLSCEKDKKDQTEKEGSVSFALNFSGLKKSSDLKSANILSDASRIILTIKNSDGSSTKYTSAELNILSMNGVFYSQKIALKVGSYMLTEFSLINASGNTIYTTPLTGSLQAQNVTNPLPINFSVLKDAVTPISVEVISTEKLTPEDFGLNRFPFSEEVKVFSFLVVVANSQADELLDANLTVTSGTYTYTQDLTKTANNIITIKDELSNYTITIKKAWFKKYVQTISLADLKKHENKVGNLPLVVELTPIPVTAGLIAYYPFEGNVNDESGNGHNGTEFGTSAYLAGIFDLSRRFQIQGNSAQLNYAKIPNTVNSNEFTISFWAKISKGTGTHESFLYLSNGTQWAFSNLWIFTSGGKMASIFNGLDLRTIDYSHNALVNGQFNSMFTNSTNITTDQNVLITCTLKDHVFKYYINGQLDATYPNVTEVGNPTANIIIGACPVEFTNNFYYEVYGILDDLRIYNRALNDSEIQLIFKN